MINSLHLAAKMDEALGEICKETNKVNLKRVYEASRCFDMLCVFDAFLAPPTAENLVSLQSKFDGRIFQISQGDFIDARRRAIDELYFLIQPTLTADREHKIGHIFGLYEWPAMDINSENSAIDIQEVITGDLALFGSFADRIILHSTERNYFTHWKIASAIHYNLYSSISRHSIHEADRSAYLLLVHRIWLDRCLAFQPTAICEKLKCSQEDLRGYLEPFKLELPDFFQILANQERSLLFSAESLATLRKESLAFRIAFLDLLRKLGEATTLKDSWLARDNLVNFCKQSASSFPTATHILIERLPFLPFRTPGPLRGQKAFWQSGPFHWANRGLVNLLKIPSTLSYVDPFLQTNGRTMHNSTVLPSAKLRNALCVLGGALMSPT